MRLLMVWDFITDWDFRIPDWKRSRTVSGIRRWNLSCNKVKYDKRIKKRGYAVRAMDYISSTNICYLACDTLGLIDKRPITHGMRVAYMMMKLLECKGGYDEYEAAGYFFP